MMRARRIFLLLGIFGVTFGALASPQASAPKLKPGLWEYTRTLEMHMKIAKKPLKSVVVVKACLDDKILQSKVEELVVPGVSCTTKESHAGATTTRDTTCTGESPMTGHEVTTYQSSTAFTQVGDSHGPDSKSHRFLSAKWLSAACPSGMKPGDSMTPDGNILHLGNSITH